MTSRPMPIAALTIALALILGFMAFEIVVGIMGHSLALRSDAAHMLTDAGALVPRSRSSGWSGARPADLFTAACAVPKC
jgi:Co/Zn/Cd efflux system component